MKLPIKEVVNANYRSPSLQRVRPSADNSLVSFGESVLSLTDQWQRAEVSANYTTSTNRRKSQINELLFEAQNNTDPYARESYLQQLENMRSSRASIGDPRSQRIFDSETDLAINNASLNIKGMYKSKLVNHQKTQILEYRHNAQQEYNQIRPAPFVPEKQDFEINEFQEDQEDIQDYQSFLEDATKRRREAKDNESRTQAIRDAKHARKMLKIPPEERAEALEKRRLDRKNKFEKEEGTRILGLRKEKAKQDRIRAMEHAQLERQKVFEARAKHKQDTRDFLKTQLDIGFITPEVYQDELNTMRSWDYDRALDDISQSPAYVIDTINDYDLDATQRADVLHTADATQKKLNILADRRKLVLQNDISHKLAQTLLDNPNMTVAGQKKEIREAELNGLDSKYAGKLIRFIESSEALKKEDQVEEHAKMIRMLYAIEPLSGVDSEDYIRRSMNYRDLILTNSKLTPETRNKIYRQFTQITSGELAEKLKRLKSRDRLKGADSKFKIMVQDIFQGEALIEYYNATEGVYLDKKKDDELIARISKKYQSKQLKQEFDAINRAKLEYGENADIKVKRKGNRRAVLLIIDGKVDKVIEELKSE